MKDWAKTILIGAVLLAIALLVWFGIYSRNQGPVMNTEMPGRIVETGQNFVEVEGVIGGITKTVKFKITAETILKNNSIVITKEQMQSGKQFSPQVQQKEGEISDLVPGVRISRVTATDDLLKRDEAIALEIIYTTYDLPSR